MIQMTRTRKALAGAVALLAVAALSIGGSMAGWVDDAVVITPVQASSLEFTIDGQEVNFIAPMNETSATGPYIAPDEYAGSQFTPMIVSSDDATMMVDVTVEVSGVGATPFPGLSYAIVPGDTLEADYASVAFRPLVNATLAANDWYTVPVLGPQQMANITPSQFNTTVANAGGTFKILFKADGALVEGSTVEPQFKFITTQLANA